MLEDAVKVGLDLNIKVNIKYDESSINCRVVDSGRGGRKREEGGWVE